MTTEPIADHIADHHDDRIETNETVETVKTLMTVETPKTLSAPSPLPKQTATSLPKYARDKTRQYEGDPWSRQSGESAKAFRAFCIYIELEPENRTQIEALRRYAEENGTKPSRNGGGWPSKHRWTERAEAFDSFMAAKMAAKLQRRALKAAERHADENEAALEVLTMPAKILRERIREQLGEDGTTMFDQLADDQLLKLVATLSPQTPALQKSEREALAAATVNTPGKSTEQLKKRAEAVKVFMGNRELRGMVERVVFESVQEVDAEG